MAVKKIVKKKVTTTKPKAKVTTISVGRPTTKPPITVLGIDFEQGSNLKFGKCSYKPNPHQLGGGRIAVPYYFINVGQGNYILWRVAPGGTYLDYLSARDPNFTNQYDMLDWDTPDGRGQPRLRRRLRRRDVL